MTAFDGLTFNVDTVKALQQRSVNNNFQKDFEHLQEQICLAARRGDKEVKRRMDYVSRYRLIEEMKDLGFDVELLIEQNTEYAIFRW